MRNRVSRRSGRARLAILAIAVVAALFVSACGSGEEEPTPTVQSQPITFPYILAGTFTVDGEPGPVGSKIFTMLNGAQSGEVTEAIRAGSYQNLLAGANSTEDFGKEVTIHLGDPNGDSVEADESFIFNPPGGPQLITVNLTFPSAP